jgi:hypothetical protein
LILRIHETTPQYLASNYTMLPLLKHCILMPHSVLAEDLTDHCFLPYLMQAQGPQLRFPFTAVTNFYPNMLAFASTANWLRN